jgi:hypothetical protein
MSKESLTIKTLLNIPIPEKFKGDIVLANAQIESSYGMMDCKICVEGNADLYYLIVYHRLVNHLSVPENPCHDSNFIKNIFEYFKTELKYNCPMKDSFHLGELNVQGDNYLMIALDLAEQRALLPIARCKGYKTPSRQVEKARVK